MANAPKWMTRGGAAVLGGLGVAASVASNSDPRSNVLFAIGMILAAGGAIAVVIGLVLFIKENRRRTRNDRAFAELSNDELKDRTATLAGELWEFQKKYSNSTSRHLARRMAEEDQLTEEERNRRFWEQNTADNISRNALMAEFGPLRARAMATRDEALRRLGRPRPRMDDPHVTILDRNATTVLEYGSLAGPHPVDDLAAYLDTLVQGLPSS